MTPIDGLLRPNRRPRKVAAAIRGFECLTRRPRQPTLPWILTHMGNVGYNGGLMPFRRITIVGVALALASCASPEFREEKDICTATWMKKIPPRYGQETYNNIQSRQVPTGQTTCTTTGYGYSAYTNCTQSMRTEFYTVPAVRTVDRNKGERDERISACTQQKCYAKYGNVECKT